MPKVSKSKEDKVTIYYWKEGVGHVALQTHRGGIKNAGYYVSFYPATQCCLLSASTKPEDFSTLVFPDDCHSCYIQADDSDSLLYYADRKARVITSIVIPEDKRTIFIEQISKIKKSESLGNSDLETIKSLTNHIPLRGVTITQSYESRNGIFHSFEEDRKPGTGTPEKVRLYSLNIDRINEVIESLITEDRTPSAAHLMLEHLAHKGFLKSKLHWNLLEVGASRNCSGVVAFLLKEGGINNIFSRWDKIKTGLALGGVIGGLAGGIVGGIAGGTAVITSTGASFLPILGITVIIFGTGIVLPAALLVAGTVGLTVAGATAGAVVGAAGGAAIGGISEYICTEYTLGKMLLTPGDILNLVKLAEKAEQDAGTYNLDFSKRCQRLIDRCQMYSSSMEDKMKAVEKLRSSLERRLREEESLDKTRAYVSRFLDNPSSPIFKASFFRKSTVRSMFEDSLDLVNADLRSTIPKDVIAANSIFGGAGRTIRAGRGYKTIVDDHSDHTEGEVEITEGPSLLSGAGAKR